MGLLSRNWILKIHTTAIKAQIEEPAKVLEDPAFVATLADDGDPATRMLKQLEELNRTPRLLDDGQGPLRVWLLNANELAKERVEGAVFGEALAALDAAEKAPADFGGRLLLAPYSGDPFWPHPLPDSGELTIGRGDDNDMRLDDASVSRRHAVVHVGARIEIEDLGGPNGTYVEEMEGDDGGAVGRGRVKLAPNERVPISLGCRITLGKAHLTLRRAPPRRDSNKIKTTKVLLAEVVDSPTEVAFVGAPSLQALHERAFLAAQGMINVLIIGEAGVGKEVLAREIHRRSRRAAGPFLAVSCTLPKTHLEAELFGRTEARSSEARPGSLEAAAGGTIFLEDVDKLSQMAQIKLYHALAERRVFHVGGHTPHPIDVRVISCSSRDLEAQGPSDVILEDLLLHLNDISFVIPPLRNRVADIAFLARDFLARAATSLGRATPPTLSDATLGCLEHYAWRGNVRELRSVMEAAVVLCRGDELLPEHLPRRIARTSDVTPPEAAGDRKTDEPPPAR